MLFDLCGLVRRSYRDLSYDRDLRVFAIHTDNKPSPEQNRTESVPRIRTGGREEEEGEGADGVLRAWGRAEVEEVDFASRRFESGGRHRPRRRAETQRMKEVVQCRAAAVCRLFKCRRRVPQIAFFGSQRILWWCGERLGLNHYHADAL